MESTKKQGCSSSHLMASSSTLIASNTAVVDYIADCYTIICRGKDPHNLIVNARQTILEGISQLTGKSVQFGDDAMPESFDPSVGCISEAAEILIGNTNRKESITAGEKLKALDYIIQVTGRKIVVLGGTNFSTAAAASKFVELLTKGEIDLSSYIYKHEYLKEHPLHPLCTDISSFVPVWSEMYRSPAWVGDFCEKIYTATHSLKTGAGRPSTFAHRGDMSFYPEGSLEGIISAYLAGADRIEVDVRLTKDYIPVSFHDESLKDLTNWSDLAGTNGLPSSEYIRDWTFKELQQLRFVKSGVLTDYRIVSFYDALAFAGGKVLLGIDDKTEISPDLDEDLFPLGRDADGLEALFRTVSASKAAEWATRDGVSLRFIQNVQFFQNCMQANGADIAGAKAYYNTEFISQEPFNEDYESQSETEIVWQTLIDRGYRTIGTNRIVALCNYIDSVYTPSEYSAVGQPTAQKPENSTKKTFA